ncbi:MAG: energy transducer TonB [Hyphomicrobiales bacterium]|uniref:energy transducer TonB family protein n=1 Tax=Shimia thalassica TaxID=1715693 RepID=UPI003299A805
MKHYLEALAFFAVAIALHIAVLARGPEEGGEAGGIGGEAFVTLAGTTNQIEQVLADWTKAPDHHVEIEQDLTPPVPEVPDTPTPPAFEAEIAPRAAVQIAALTPMEKPSLPEIDTAPAVRPEPKPEPKPDPKTVEETPPPPAPPKAVEKKPEPEKKKTQKKKADKTTKASVAGQKAAGSGGTSNAGNAGKTTAIGKGQEQKLRAIWGSKVRSRIERSKRAPRGMRQKGIVGVRLTLSPSGHLQSVRVSKSSGVADYDQAAVAAVKRAGRFAKAPKKLTKASYGFTFRLTFN